MSIFREVTLPEGVPGRLLLHSMPGRDEPWSEFLKAAASAGVTDLVCLTPWAEMRAKSPEYAAAVESGGALPFEFHSAPVPDFDLPKDPDLFLRHVVETGKRLESGAVVLIHCGAGIGRTGTVAVCVLRQLGVRYETAVRQVREAGSGPETEPQRELARSLAGAP